MAFSPEVIDSNRPPVFVGAGFNKAQIPALQLAYEDTLAAQTLGSFTLPEWGGNGDGGRNNVTHWDAANGAFYNSIGLENPGKDNGSEYLPETTKIIKAYGQLAIVSVTTLKHEDPKEVLPVMAAWGVEMGADIVEINGSCPNQDPAHPLMCFDVDTTGEVLELVRDEIGPDVAQAYKVSPMPQATIERYKAEALPFDIVITTNTKGNQPVPINPQTGKPYIEVNDGLAGMSGPIIRDLARENLVDWVDGPYTVFSLGGVSGGAEVHLRQQLGATLVGGVQEFYRARNPRHVAARWAQEYVQAT